MFAERKRQKLQKPGNEERRRKRDTHRDINRERWQMFVREGKRERERERESLFTQRKRKKKVKNKKSNERKTHTHTCRERERESVNICV